MKFFDLWRGFILYFFVKIKNQNDYNYLYYKPNVFLTDIGSTCLVHVCSVCRKIMPSRGALKRHMRIHSGEQPFTCRICLRKFNQKGSLKRHHFAQHRGEEWVDTDWTVTLGVVFYIRSSVLDNYWVITYSKRLAKDYHLQHTGIWNIVIIRSMKINKIIQNYDSYKRQKQQLISILIQIYRDTEKMWIWLNRRSNFDFLKH
jgi:hypothetical protein